MALTGRPRAANFAAKLEPSRPVAPVTSIILFHVIETISINSKSILFFSLFLAS
jgi:mRNA-degrading endonuclease toxin of MazEF toxin-antitoxin module